jgi:F-type H+-transporting ATPase subunit gamma
MANVRDFRTRIRSVLSTQQITRAMKLMSAARLRRSQERILAARPYARKMAEVLSSLAARANPEKHPLLARRPEKRVALVVITADKGLCGSFNSNILDRAEDFLEAPGDRAIEVDIIGKKARDWFRPRTYTTRRVITDLFRNVTLAQAKEIAADLMRGFVSGECDAVYLLYNEFKSVIQQRIVIEPLLPIPRDAFAEAAAKPGQAAPAPPLDYIYEPGDEKIFAALLPKHVEIQVYRALLESSAAEHAARMTAMDNATRNAGEMISSLTLTMNKIRQSSITKEILEVVSGAEALR